ncbi:MAG: hypothetical protein JWN67_1128 [Actinomycetia bacterium]|nr:hypothetical protein [Actinomycetes bacterium]
MSDPALVLAPTAGLVPGELQELLDGHRLVRHLPNHLDVGYCDQVVAAVRTLELSPYPATVGVPGAAPVLKVGPTVFDHVGTDFASYFDEVAACSRRLRACFARAGIIDPLDFVLDFLRRSWDGPVVIAEEGGRPYFAGVLRSIPGGTLPHTDDAARETPDLSIGRTKSQGSLLLYLAMPTAGGSTTVYDKRPTDDDPTYAWGYAQAALAGVGFAGVTATAGDVVLFPSTRIHEVAPVTGVGDRLTFSVFYGPDEHGRLVVWS